MKKHQATGVYITLLIIALAFVASLITTKNESIQDISYSQFIKKVYEHKIASVKIQDNQITAVPVAVTTGKKANTVEKFRIYIPKNYTGIIDKLEKNNVDIDITQPSEVVPWVGLVGSLLIPLVLLVALILILRSAQGGGSQAMSFGKSKAKMMLDNKVKVTFNDVAGIDEAKQELEEVVDFLKNGERYLALGAKIPKGVLLVGAPGTGKTLMAKAVAGEAGVPFFSISGSDFVEMFVGVGASRVRDLFEQAKKHAPCIVFIDEIDAVGRQRGAGMGGGHDEREQTLNQLLVEMDGFDGTTNIIIVAATNRPDILDNALLRPGRFDRQVVIDKPDIQGREQILNVHIKGKPLSEDIDIKVIARRTPGFTGADLSNVLNEGALLAARHNKKEIEMSDIEEGIDKVMVGMEKKSKIISEKDKEITAYHEVGHALVSKMLTHCDPLHKITIIPRGFALGLAWYLPKENEMHITKSKLLDQITVSLGGRVAEELVYNEISTGASSDIENATNTARKMITVWGMSEKLGPIAFGKANQQMFMGRDFGSEKNFSEEIACAIDREIKQIFDDRYDLAKKILNENRDMMDAIVRVLLEKETLDEKEVNEIIERVKSEREEIDRLS